MGRWPSGVKVGTVLLVAVETGVRRCLGGHFWPGCLSCSPKQKEVVQRSPQQRTVRTLAAIAVGEYGGRHRCNGGTDHPDIMVWCRL
jgi:hypothetical protein